MKVWKDVYKWVQLYLDEEDSRSSSPPSLSEVVSDTAKLVLYWDASVQMLLKKLTVEKKLTSITSW